MADDNDYLRQSSAGRPSDPEALLPATVQQQNGWTIVHLNEPSLMNPEVVEALGERVNLLVGEGHKRIILDFSEVQYISSSMIGALVGSRQRVNDAGGQLVLCSLNDRLLELLKITRLHRMFTIERSLHDATSRPEGA